MAKLGQIIHSPNGQNDSSSSSVELIFTKKGEHYKGVSYNDAVCHQAIEVNRNYSLNVEGRNLGAETNYDIILKSSGASEEQYIGSFNCQQGQREVFSFSPRMSFDQIVITASEKSFCNTLKWDVQPEGFHICMRELPNQVSDTNGGSWSRVGIQSLPGAHFMINQEEFMMGKTGVFELTEKIVNVTQFSIIDTDMPFIIDYQVGLDDVANSGSGNNNPPRKLAEGATGAYGSVMQHLIENCKCDNNTCHSATTSTTPATQ